MSLLLMVDLFLTLTCFNSVYVGVSVWRYMLVSKGISREQKRTPVPLELDLQTIVDCLTCVLETKLQSFAITSSVLNL